MLNSLIIEGDKGKKLPEQKFKKSGWRSFRYFHKLSKYPKIFQKAQKLREEMHFN